MADWSTIVNSTTSKFLKEVEVNILRGRKLLALMQSKGRVSYDGFGKNLDWKVKYKRAPLLGFADGDTVTFARRDRYKTATLDWRGYQLTDMQSKMDRLKNRSTAQIIDLYATIVEDMMDDIEDQFADQLYIDGYAAGNGKFIHGIESFLGVSGTVGGTSLAANPSDTYGGLSTALGAYGGAWTGDWPTGKGNAEYDFWSPTQVDVSNTNWAGTGTQNWAKNGFDACRYASIKMRRNKSKKGMLDLILCNDEVYRKITTIAEAQQRMVIQKGGTTQGMGAALWALGFGDVINIEGVDVTSEYGMPIDTAYAFNTQQMELISMQPKLFVPTGPVFSEETSTYRFLIDFYGNAKFNPRFQGKLYPYT